MLLGLGFKSIPRDWINGRDRLLFVLRGSSSLHPPPQLLSGAQSSLWTELRSRRISLKVSTQGFLLVRDNTLSIKYYESSKPHVARNVFRSNLSKQSEHLGCWCVLFQTPFGKDPPLLAFYWMYFFLCLSATPILLYRKKAAVDNQFSKQKQWDVTILVTSCDDAKLNQSREKMGVWKI